VTVGDFNNDKKLDLVVTNDNDATVSVLLGNGDGTFQTQVKFAVGDEPFYVVVGDFNNDAKQDLAVVNFVSSSVVCCLAMEMEHFKIKLCFQSAGDQPLEQQVISTTTPNWI
jgi:hypothetical protein